MRSPRTGVSPGPVSGAGPRWPSTTERLPAWSIARRSMTRLDRPEGARRRLTFATPGRTGPDSSRADSRFRTRLREMLLSGLRHQVTIGSALLVLRAPLDQLAVEQRVDR